jgi:hypothetical protein
MSGRNTPNRRWVGDTTEFVIGESGKLYLAMDAFFSSVKSAPADRFASCTYGTLALKPIKARDPLLDGDGA